MELGEVIEALEGCVKVLAHVDEDHHDQRLAAVRAALRACVEPLEVIYNEED